MPVSTRPLGTVCELWRVIVRDCPSTSSGKEKGVRDRDGGPAVGGDLGCNALALTVVGRRSGESDWCVHLGPGSSWNTNTAPHTMRLGRWLRVVAVGSSSRSLQRVEFVACEESKRRLSPLGNPRDRWPPDPFERKFIELPELRLAAGWNPRMVLCLFAHVPPRCDPSRRRFRNMSPTVRRKNPLRWRRRALGSCFSLPQIPESKWSCIVESGSPGVRRELQFI